MTHVGTSVRPLAVAECPGEAAVGRLLARGDGVEHYETVRRRRDGGRVEVTVSATLADVGAHRFVLYTVRDAAEREARERTEEMLRLKSSFLNNMSHELRTPLTGILGSAELLADEVDEPHRESVEIIASGARRLHETLNSVLDLAQIESGTIALHPEPPAAG